MDVSTIAAAASSNAMSQVQQQASVSVLKKAIETQEQSAMQLLQAIPAPPPMPTGTAGGIIDTWV